MWTRAEGKRVRIGLTRSLVAAEPVTFIELVPAGSVLERGEAMALVQRRRGREFELDSPVAGRLVEVNRQVNVVDDPALLNADPEGAGWLALVEP